MKIEMMVASRNGRFHSPSRNDFIYPPFEHVSIDYNNTTPSNFVTQKTKKFIQFFHSWNSSIRPIRDLSFVSVKNHTRQLRG